MRKFVTSFAVAALFAAPAFAHVSSPSVSKTFSTVSATGGSVASSSASLNSSNKNEQSGAFNAGFSTTTVGTSKGDTASGVTTISKDNGAVSSSGNGFASANESGSAESSGETFGFSAGKNFGF